MINRTVVPAGIDLFTAAAAVLVAEGSVGKGIGTFELGITEGRFLEIVKFGDLGFNGRCSRRTRRRFNFGVFV